MRAALHHHRETRTHNFVWLAIWPHDVVNDLVLGHQHFARANNHRCFFTFTFNVDHKFLWATTRPTEPSALSESYEFN